MRTKQLYKTVEVTIMDVDKVAGALHSHHYFQLAYVLEGSGIHTINNNSFEFAPGDAFLLVPGDQHSFVADPVPKFCMIDFTQSLFSKNNRDLDDVSDLSESFKRLEYIFHNLHGVNGKIIRENDKAVFNALIEQLISEQNKDLPFGKAITQNVIFLLLNLIARNIQQTLYDYSLRADAKNKTHNITAYIQHNIYDREAIKVENIAAHFGLSEGHLSRYFRQQSGSSIKEYITRYKMEIISTRLKFSDLTISEIADELNFTDESHLNKAFKNTFGKTAKQFRNEFARTSSATYSNIAG
ncbi:AraC family transcriptional regulator [Mucilaginibacter pocheonensis]|uniref:AraC-like DNA-binding protein n=1 Tax=Mucilaginibacter pocheonensis TaxID=398050 RepID=A0ABU1TEA2_9SPHI|nr:AraC family transcriptional regulator [Mucilaginibacter pocheonensis]MDR6943728.1 AraC-like DNA-binding protein [Mucilaginibacter pocheonensis]